MEIVVYDTNVIIDLHDTGLLTRIGNSGWKIHTTRLVMDELKSPSRQLVLEMLPTLQVQEYDGLEAYLQLTEYMDAVESKGNLSLTDCSVLKLAQELSATLCTSDMKLRKVATGKKIEVKGSLGIILLMQTMRIIKAEEARGAIDVLERKNPRLGQQLCEAARKEVERIKQIQGGEETVF